MPLKNLLLVIGKDTEAGEHYALELAQLSGAALTVTSSGAGPSLPAFICSELPSDLLDHMRDDMENTARAELEAFSVRAKQTGVTVETVMLDLATGDVSREISRLARYFDATVLQQLRSPTVTTSTRSAIASRGKASATARAAGHPSSHAIRTASNCIGPWRERTTNTGRPDPNRTASMRSADSVPAGSGGDRSRLSSHLVHHLARHGIEAQMTSLVNDQGSVASALLSHAADVKADLIVMGGYGHSRLREIVLGGTTRRILQTMTIPVLMAH
jgi:nucleotide-binding universal stress UspA family protein